MAASGREADAQSGVIQPIWTAENGRGRRARLSRQSIPEPKTMGACQTCSEALARPELSTAQILSRWIPSRPSAWDGGGSEEVTNESRQTDSAVSADRPLCQVRGVDHRQDGLDTTHRTCRRRICQSQDRSQSRQCTDGNDPQISTH